MASSFWIACTEALQACRRSDFSDLTRSLRAAEAALTRGSLNDAMSAKRRDCIARIKDYIRNNHQSLIHETQPQATDPVDETLFYPRQRNVALRRELSIPQDHLVLVVIENGLTLTKRNLSLLSEAVQLMNRQSVPVTMVRAARNPLVRDTLTQLNVKDLGSVAPDELADIMAAGDIVICAVETGSSSEDERHTRLLECFAMGRPLILPRSLLGLDIVNRRDAYVLNQFEVADVVAAVQEIEKERGLAETLASCAVDFYLTSTAKQQNIGSEPAVGRRRSPRDTASTIMVTPHIDTPETDSVQESNEIRKLNARIQQLEEDKRELSLRLRSMPSIDPLCLGDSRMTQPIWDKEDFGIIVFGHTRLDTLAAVLESLNRQNALKYTEVWLDGFQGNPQLKRKVEKTADLVNTFPVKHLHRQAGNFGFRKMLILGLVEMCKKYRDILVLEDDCFPTHDAVSGFRQELDLIRDDDRIFSVYGHHFLVDAEKETCTRFQGWGWATTSEKLTPLLRQLIDCYSMTEDRFLKFVNCTLTADVKKQIDVTPPRQPSYVLENFFAWDETLCLLTALNKQVHKPTRRRTIYNCGMGEESTHFADTETFRQPPFNLITPNEVWQYY